MTAVADFLDLVTRLAERAPPAVMSREECREAGHAAEQLISAGALVPADNLGAVVCDSCADPHPATVIHEDGLGGWGHLCPEAGWVKVEDALIEALEFRHDWLAEACMEALGLERRGGPRCLMPGQLWDLGDVAAGRQRWSALLACRVRPEAGGGLDRLLETMETRAGKFSGIVLTTSDISPVLPLPNRHRLMHLSDAVAGREHPLRFDMAATHRVLRRTRGDVSEAAPRRRGRPGAKEEVLRIYRGRAARGEAKATTAEEARMIKQIIHEERPLLPEVSEKTIINIIGKERSKLA